MGGQGRGRRLTDRERLEIGEFARLHPQVTHVELAAAYRVNESTIRKWRRKSNVTKVRARCVSSGSGERRRGQTERARQFDLLLYDWICAARSRGEKLRPIQVRDKARALATIFEQMENFKASSGWYYRYCRRFNLTLDASVATVQGGDSAHSATSNGAGSGGVDADSMASEGLEAADILPFELLTPAGVGDCIESACGAAGVILVAHEESSVDKTRHIDEPEEARATAIAHFLHHHAALLARASRMRFIKHLADGPEELKAFTRMTTDARVQYAKSFAGVGSHDSVEQSSYVYRPALVL